MMKTIKPTMRVTDKVKCRVEFLKQFDYYVRNIIGDDSITMNWLMGGVPDGADKIDLIEIAESDELWLNCVKCFARCCERGGVL